MLDGIALWLADGPLDHLTFEYVRAWCAIVTLVILTCIVLILIDVIRRPSRP
jgi:hypothetical protein